MRDLATEASPVTKEGESTGFLAAHLVLSPSAQAKYGIESERVEFLRSVSKELPLPDYMRPTIKISVDGLPLTPNGKLDRKAISQLEFFSVPDAHCWTAVVLAVAIFAAFHRSTRW